MDYFIEIIVTQSVGNASLDTRHPHMADPVLVFRFYKHGEFDVPQRLYCNLGQSFITLWGNTVHTFK